MSYWLREIAGWALVVLGLYVFTEAYDMLLRKRVFEAAPVTFMGFVIYRGGVHLLKVAAAARAARALPAVAPSPARRPRPVVRQVGAPASVLPGPAGDAR